MIQLPIVYTPAALHPLSGATWPEVQPFYAGDPIRQIERASIRAFIEKHRGYLKGRVLDFGAGKPATCQQPEPYRDLVQGAYVPIDKGDRLPDGPFEAALMTQVVQYLPDPVQTITWLHTVIRSYLVLTYPCCWSDADTDLWRYTKAAMTQIVEGAGFKILHHELRAVVQVGNFSFPLGYGLVAQA